jgi:hypothetical protein
MDQVFEGSPKAEVRLEGRKVVRGDVVHDWGSRLQWVVKKDGQVVATPPARADHEFEHDDQTPGKYEVSLQLWKYDGYQKDKDGNFTKSKYVDISNTVSYTI